ncbi:MAG: SPFH domain-containing protein [Oscillospiraceae bacterium]|jgi:regulator of protease activity HflC (stomatin/prohibitin superfamily)|nr:SPFH domain-containing protein [Oscillospiraceae bacterium]
MATIKNDTLIQNEEIEMRAMGGMSCMVMNIIAILACIGAFVYGIICIEQSGSASVPGILFIVIGSIYAFILGPMVFVGLKVIKPNEALVFTLFGRYVGTLKGSGFYWVNPFCIAVNPTAGVSSTLSATLKPQVESPIAAAASINWPVNRKISLKAMTLSNDRQKINDQLGNPIIIGIVVIWKVVNTAKAVFSVDNYKEFLSIQCDSALRNIVRLYPYDSVGKDNEESLRGSSMEVAEKLKAEIQSKVDVAGLEIIEARITHLSYSEEIAAVMLQRQQASAIIDARNMIVEGAVGMVEMALAKLSENDIVKLDEERKAAMVSNLLVVLCGNRDAQPVVNSGSLY